MAAKATFPYGQIYCASKFGVDGFMKAFYDELLLNNQDKFIHLSTVYPMLINTRKELIDKLENVKFQVPAMPPEYVASEVVKNVKRNKKSILVPWFSCVIPVFNW
jgi:short-subunit dehydrogenase